MIQFIKNTEKYYHPQVFLEKYKCVVREKKISNFITDDIEIFFDQENSDQKIQMKKMKHINLFLEKFTKLVAFQIPS